MATNGVNGHVNGVNGHGGNALCSVDEFVSQKYDFVVVGGGTAGLCVAVRLTEDPNVTVGVLEAGENRMDDKSVSTPSLYPTLIGRKEYDWCMTSIPQPTAGNKVYSMPRGKLLGGSSGIVSGHCFPCPKMVIRSNMFKELSHVCERVKR